MSRLSQLRLGTAPDSWGVWFPNDPNQVTWDVYLDEIDSRSELRRTSLRRRWWLLRRHDDAEGGGRGQDKGRDRTLKRHSHE